MSQVYSKIEKYTLKVLSMIISSPLNMLPAPANKRNIF
jgi:hypothetical protein